MIRPNNCGVYSITHVDTGRQYIGASNDIHRRWLRHQWGARNYGAESIMPIERAIYEHGVGAFELKVIAVVPEDQLKFYERRFINGYGTRVSGFNVGGVRGWPSNEELAEMPQEVQASWNKRRSERGKHAAAVMREVHGDPIAREKHLAAQRAGIAKRDERLAHRRATDPAYAEAHRARMKALSARASEVLAQRMEDDPKYANRARQRAMHARAGRTWPNAKKRGPRTTDVM